MNRFSLAFVVLSATLSLTSCNKSKVKIEDSFLNEISEGISIRKVVNKYHKEISEDVPAMFSSREIGSVKYSIKYVPALREAMNKNDFSIMDSSEIREIVKEYSDFEQYYLRIEPVDGKGDIIRYNIHSQKEYQERINYLSTRFQDKIYMVNGGDTLQCALFHFERNFGLKSYCSISLEFNKATSNNNNDRIIIIDDDVFEGTIVKLSINSSKLKELGYL